MAALRTRLRLIVRTAALVLAVTCFLYAALLVVFGGFDTSVFGYRVRSHDSYRLLQFGLVAVFVFVLADGPERARSLWLAIGGRVQHRWPAIGLAVFVGILGLAYGTRTAGGADSYGYLSQADLWLQGHLKVSESWIAPAPWPSSLSSVTPLGYRPVENSSNWEIVPTYSAGLPLLMAAAKSIGGQRGAYMVVPAFGALMVLATFGVGRRLGQPESGLVAAALVATSPVFLFMLMSPMSDVPAASAWTLAFYFLLGDGLGSAAAAGVAAAIAILIRPNLFFGAGVFGLWFLSRIRAGNSDARRRHLVQAVVFAVCVSSGLLAIASINRWLYGSPMRSGYGPFLDQFVWSNVVPNARNYVTWLIGAQTVLALAGVGAIFVPLRRLWPHVGDRFAVVIMALFVGGIWLQYCAYEVFSDWWFLRFFLPSWPFMMLGLASLLCAATRSPRPALALLGAAAVVALCVRGLHESSERGVFSQWEGERRYISAARFVSTSSGDQSVIFAMLHGGSVRYYGGRVTLRYDVLDPVWLDRSVQWLTARGIHPYALLDEGEVGAFRQRFAGQATLSALEKPVFVYQARPEVFFFDLAPGAVTATTQFIPQAFIDTQNVAPVPLPRIALTK